MDEAERCHSIAYIAYGKLLAHGTSRELINLFPLKIYSVCLKQGFEPSVLTRIARRIEAQVNVDVVISFGNDLHVGGADNVLLDEAIKPWLYDTALIWSEKKASLEDLFILLMHRALKEQKNKEYANA